MKRTPLRRTRPLARKTALRRVNHARIRARRAVCFGPQSALARSLPCCSCGAPPPSDPSHLTTRGAGGRDDVVVPQCRACHIALGVEGKKSFWSRRNIDPQTVLTRMREMVARGLVIV